MSQARLELSQVSDAERFVGAGMDAAQQRAGQRAELLQALLVQAPGERTSLSELACTLCALNNGRLDGSTADTARVRPCDAPAAIDANPFWANLLGPRNSTESRSCSFQNLKRPCWKWGALVA